MQQFVMIWQHWFHRIHCIVFSCESGEISFDSNVLKYRVRFPKIIKLEIKLYIYWNRINISVNDFDVINILMFFFCKEKIHPICLSLHIVNIHRQTGLRCYAEAGFLIIADLFRKEKPTWFCKTWSLSGSSKCCLEYSICWNSWMNLCPAQFLDISTRKIRYRYLLWNQDQDQNKKIAITFKYCTK